MNDNHGPAVAPVTERPLWPDQHSNGKVHLNERVLQPSFRPAGGITAWWRGDHIVYRASKRAVDIVGAGLGLLVASPVLLASAVAIRLESPGPALFRQQRIGLRGVPFTLFKFRGMYVDARERFPKLYAYQYSPDELPTLVFHPTDDPRVTRAGRVLRRTSIDELPNLWNVLKGEMSLVGPRPEIPEMMQYYGQAADVILSVKPGVTSPAKVSGRDELTFSETLELDLAYIQQRSFWLDLKILGLTAIAVIRQDGIA